MQVSITQLSCLPSTLLSLQCRAQNPEVRSNRPFFVTCPIQCDAGPEPATLNHDIHETSSLHFAMSWDPVSSLMWTWLFHASQVSLRGGGRGRQGERRRNLVESVAQMRRTLRIGLQAPGLARIPESNPAPKSQPEEHVNDSPLDPTWA